MINSGLGTWLHRRRVKSPDKLALIYGDDGRLSYREFADRTDAVAAQLWQRGVRKGDIVAYIGENSPELLMSLFATVQLGAIFAPINTRLAAPEIEYVLNDSGAQTLIHDPELAGTLAAVIERLNLSTIIVTGSGSSDSPGLSALIEGNTAPAPPPTPVTFDDPAIILYTSGTTGSPKGAVLSHGNLSWVSINAIVDYDLVSNDIALLISPLFHSAALGMGVLPTIVKGGTTVLERGFDPGRALELIEQHRITQLSGVPTTYQLMAEHPAWASTDLSSLSKLNCGGSAVPTRVLDAYESRGLSFTQGYGLTESSPGATCISPAMTREKQGSVGLAHFFSDVRIAGDEGGPAPAGAVGEIEIWGPNVFLGYHGLPEATAALFTADGWLRTGDLGYLDEDGYLYISDRLKDMIISGGENIYPAEIEDKLTSIEGVTGAAVIGVSDEKWGEVPWAVLTLREGVDPGSVSTEAVRTALDGQLARYKIPKNVLVVDELPRTASGKVRKADLRARFDV